MIFYRRIRRMSSLITIINYKAYYHGTIKNASAAKQCLVIGIMTISVLMVFADTAFCHLEQSRLCLCQGQLRTGGHNLVCGSARTEENKQIHGFLGRLNIDIHFFPLFINTSMVSSLSGLCSLSLQTEPS